MGWNRHPQMGDKGVDVRNRRWVRVLSILAVISLFGAACGDDDGGDGPAELRQITVGIPAPIPTPFYPLYLAESLGYLEEEGIELVSSASLESSGSVLQSVITGSTTVGLASLGPLMSGVNEDAGLVSIYALYQSEVTQIIVPVDSDIQTLEDLEGRTLGIGQRDSGTAVLAFGILAAEFDYELDVDYEVLEVGDGGTAFTAFERGEIDAYVNSFLQMAILEQRGLEFRNIMPSTYDKIPNTLAIVQQSLVENEPEIVIGIGRAMAKATAWGQENPQEVVDIMIRDWFPEGADDPAFQLALINVTNRLFQLPPAANGQWGFHASDAIDFQIELLKAQGRIEVGDDFDATEGYTNEFLDEYNDFDESDL